MGFESTSRSFVDARLSSHMCTFEYRLSFFPLASGILPSIFYTECSIYDTDMRDLKARVLIPGMRDDPRNYYKLPCRYVNQNPFALLACRFPLHD